jgi:hypothetical protein
MTSEREGQQRDAIATRAYAIYLARGGTDGLDEYDWLQAEGELRAASAQTSDRPGEPLPDGTME